jgi:DNA-binding transcriptional MocR family regulator
MKTISFARGVPAPECLPIEELADCAKTAVGRDGAAALLYGHTLGYQPLREWIGERHKVEPERVVVTNGSLQAFHFVLSSFSGRVIVERPTYDRPRKVLNGFDEVGLDDDGLDVGELEGLLGSRLSRTHAGSPSPSSDAATSPRSRGRASRFSRTIPTASSVSTVNRCRRCSS